jgi:hypothetical protein
MADAGLPRRGPARDGARRRRAGTRTAGAVAILALAVAGCATVPTSGAPQLARGSTGQPQVYPQLIAVGPGPKWRPEQIVLGFLHASAAFTNDHAVARRYLTPAMRRKWHPGWAATVVAGQPRLSPSAPLKNIKVPPGSLPVTITLTGQRLATVSDNGQYNPAQGAAAYRFVLVKNDGQWRIDRLPSGRSLLLYESDFDRVYQPHNLYFFTPAGPSLVPDPVFVPQQATNADLATGLVKALLAKRQGWLTGATSTRFPAGTTLLGGQVKISGSGAIVNLGGAAARASALVRREMAAQLVSTLASSAYTPSAIQSVQMQINGVAATATVGLAGTADAYKQDLPREPAGRPYFLGDGGLSLLSGGGNRPVASLAHPLSAIAVAPGDSQIAGISVTGKKVCAVYSGPPRRAARFVRRQIDGGRCTSLSWDSRGEIFVAAGNTLWMLPPGRAGAVPVTNLIGSQRVTDLRVAPDGVRLAMLIRNPDGTSQVAIGALIRNGVQLSITRELPVGAVITDPSQLAWYGPYSLLVLSRPGPHARLYEVPVNGSTPTRVNAVPGTVSIATDGTALAAGTDLGKIWESAGPNLPWRPAATGYSPAYPG